MALLPDLRHRLSQVAAALSPVIPPGCDELAARILSPSLLHAFLGCNGRDRAHQCRVSLALHRSGADDPVLLAAALLHDIGKSSAARPPSLFDRVALVVLARLAPGLLPRAPGLSAAEPLSRLAVAARHAELGADRLRRIGADPYLVWLVRHHHDLHIRDDPALARLQAADRSVP